MSIDKGLVITAIALLVGIGGLIVIINWASTIAGSNRIEEVIITEIALSIDTRHLDEGVVKTNAFCDEIKSHLLAQGVEEWAIRVHSQSIARNEAVNKIDGTVLVTVKRRNKYGAIDMDKTVTSVDVSDVKLLRLKSSSKTNQEYLKWAEVSF